MTMWKLFESSEKNLEGGPVAIAMSLQDLPFALAELNWDKLGIVKKTLKLSEEDAVHVMTHVLGARPSESWPVFYIAHCFLDTFKLGCMNASLFFALSSIFLG